MEENNILLDKEQLHYLLKGNATNPGGYFPPLCLKAPF